MTEVRNFQQGETVPTWAEVRTWAGVESSPDQGIKITITDPNGVVKAGRLSVESSADFTLGLTVTGETSGATGIIVEIPNGTTLHLQQVSGTWVLDETITDTGDGTSTTASALLAAAMTEEDTGSFVYYYNLAANAVKGWWRTRCIAQDGLLTSAKYTVADGGFSVG